MGARRVDFGSKKWDGKKEGQKVEEKWAKIVQSGPTDIGGRMSGGCPGTFRWPRATGTQDYY